MEKSKYSEAEGDDVFLKAEEGLRGGVPSGGPGMVNKDNFLMLFQITPPP